MTWKKTYTSDLATYIGGTYFIRRGFLQGPELPRAPGRISPATILNAPLIRDLKGHRFGVVDERLVVAESATVLTGFAAEGARVRTSK
jgi:hypothetical protein